MKKISLVLVLFFGMCAVANAQSGYREVWTCSISEGKTMDDVRAANSKWVVFINRNVDGGGITSHILTNVVGNSTTGNFTYVDAFPSLESWTAAKQASEGNAEGEAIDAELGEVAECSDNRLLEAEQS